MNDSAKLYIKECANNIREKLKTGPDKIIALYGEPIAPSDFDDPDFVLVAAVAQRESEMLKEHMRELDFLLSRK